MATMCSIVQANDIMRSFYSVLFGGLAVITLSLGIARGAGWAWSSFLSGRMPAGIASLTAASVDAKDGLVTSVKGLTKTVRYTADEEESIISAAERSLPAGADSRVTAKAYLVKDITTDTVAAAYNAQTFMPIASLSKLVTAEVARKLIPADSRIEMTPEVIATYGNTAGFKAGETFTAADLMYPMLMVSSNDAAEAFAQYYGRSRFIAAMNQFAQSIGAYRTYFADPSGLSPLNESTATDMAVIIEWILKNDPSVIDITTVKSKTVRSHTWVNPTHFLNWSYYIGGKNGYTDEAKSTGDSLFRAGPNKDTYAIVVLGSDNRDADVIKLLAKIK
ncbi:MAG: D-alanyl-D-alanine carboxypeptidase [Patescibacteria group bacterium]|nr:D-alanyl-D-alanine carboxypeptidase [Patescibacteria group bacterium]